MKINIKALLVYFDEKESTYCGDATAVISVVGEDLNAALFEHYCENIRKSKIEIFGPNNLMPPTTGKKIGRRLDRWISEKNKDEKILYQAEIKNSCSRAIGGMDIPIEISDNKLIEKIIKHWSRDEKFLEESKENGVNKVLIEMTNDKNFKNFPIYDKKEPLLIFWHPTNPNGSVDFFSRYTVKEKHFHFDYCWIFSCSLYLRYLYHNGEKEVVLKMENAKRRISDLNNLFKD